MEALQESMTHKTVSRIGKFRDSDGRVEAMSKAGMPISSLREMFADRLIAVEEHEGNVLCNLGIQALWYLLAAAAGGTITPGQFNHANALVFTGTGTPTAAATDTYTAGGAPTAPVTAVMDTGYPKFINGIYTQIAFHGTYGSGVGNQAWNEFGVINGDSPAVMLNHYVVAKGTKVTGETWTLEIDITIS